MRGDNGKYRLVSSTLIKPSGVNKHVLFKIEGTNRNSDELFIIPKMFSVVG